MAVGAMNLMATQRSRQALCVLNDPIGMTVLGRRGGMVSAGGAAGMGAATGAAGGRCGYMGMGMSMSMRQSKKIIEGVERAKPDMNQGLGPARVTPTVVPLV